MSIPWASLIHHFNPGKMKKIILLSIFFAPVLTNAQPKLVGALTYNGSANGGAIFRTNVPAFTPGIIHSFNNLAPHRPSAGVCAGNDDWLYGFLNYNGTNNNGGLYKIKRDGTGFTMLYSLTGNSSTIPYYHTDGYIYFTDAYQIKKLNPADNTVTDVGSGGYVKNLLIDANDWIYSTNGFSITKIKTDGTGWVELHTFNGPTDGLGGFAGLTETPGDSLWGVQSYGGATDEGTLYSIKKDGSGFHVHYQFGGIHGRFPESRPVYFDGKIYGTTAQGGDYDYGVLYTINADGTGYRVLHHFDPGTYSTGTVSGNISIASNGRIFGSFTQFYYSTGTPYRLFKVDTSGENFEPFLNAVSYNQHDYGHFNQDVLLTDNDENIFLTTQEMGRHDGGAFSQFDTSGFGSSLYHFGYSANGFRPMSGLIKSSNGKLYGTTQIGGTEGDGVIYSVNTDGTNYTKLHEFTDAEGYELSGKLLEASDGKLYVACHWSTASNGCIYRINKNGTGFEKIYSFMDVSEGYSPVGSLAEDNNGILYGAAFYSTPGGGVLFKMNKDGSNYTVLKNFDAVNDLRYPYTGVTIYGNYVYGVCGYGGAENKGGIFRIKKDGSDYQELHVFAGATDGNSPRSIPIIANNGKLYGTTDFGGTNGEGIVFRIDSSGSNYTILKHFTSTIDGSNPEGGLIQASDGLIYGSTNNSNISAVFGGTIYKMNLDGSGFTLVHAFDDQTEGQWVSSLLDLNGNFVLPVVLVTFNAEKRGHATLLTWKTAQENNSERFEIERSVNGITFDRIGSVAAAGNTNWLTSYSFTDNDPASGINYYRLKQIDVDGKFTYSKTVSVSFESSGKWTSWPNPASDQLNIRLPQGSGYTTIRIVDASGKMVMQKTITSLVTALDIHSLSNGWYMLQLLGKKTDQVVFIKQ
jgi:uncharacterized repeat protein (TIGR03803 family)